MPALTHTALQSASSLIRTLRSGLCLASALFGLSSSSLEARPTIIYAGGDPVPVVWEGSSGPRVLGGHSLGPRQDEPQLAAPTEGYMANLQTRPLRWGHTRAVATTTTVLRFGPRSLEVLEDLPPPPPEETMQISREEIVTTLDSRETYQDILPQVEVATITDELAGQVETEPLPQRTILDDKFVTWVTRRIDDSKVEVPFQLPTENNTEPVAPTERVRVRYRVEP